MTKQLVVCGDSFGYGIGCVNLHTEPFGVLVAAQINHNLIRLARGSASNYIIFLQAMYAAELEVKPDLVIISTTSYDRTEWFTDNVVAPYEHSLLNVNYHNYSPHSYALPHHDQPMDFFLQDHPGYNPCIVSEQIGGIDDCIKLRARVPDSNNYERLKYEPTDKLKLILDNYVQNVDSKMKQNNDIGLILQAYTYLKRRNINCIILTYEVDMYSKFIDAEDLVFQDWGKLCSNYPDSIGSMHTSEEGHLDTANRLLERIKENRYG